MADNINNIDLAVRDSIDAGIAPKLIQIADSSDRAGLAVGNLKAQLAAINTSGLGGLLAALNSSQNGVRQLAASEGNLTAQIKASNAVVSVQTISLREARAERDKLRAENAGVAVSEQATQAQWERSIAVSERATAAQQGLSEARARDAELQALSQEVADAVSGQLGRQAVAQEATAAAIKETTAATLTQDAAEERAIARWNTSIATQERQEAVQSALTAARERDVELQAFASQIGDAVAAQLDAQALATQTLAAAEKERSAALASQAELTNAQVEASAVLSSQNEFEAAAYIQLAEATSAAKAAKSSLSAVTKDVAAGNIAEEQSATLVAAALARDTEATEQLKLAQANLADVQQYLAGETAVVTEVMTANAAATRSAAAATQGLVSANVSGAAGIGILEGRMLSMNRAASNFLSRVLGLGPILQAAFPIIGAVALLSVLYQVGEALYKTIKSAVDAGHNIAIAFDSAISSLRKSNDELAVTNDKLDQTIARLEHRPTTNGAALALDEARLAADKLDTSLERVENELDKILQKNQINAFQSILTGNSATGDTSKFISAQFDNIGKARDAATEAIDAATEKKDPKAAQAATIQAYANERSAIQGVISSLNERYNTLKKTQDQFEKQGTNLVATPYGPVAESSGLKDQTANLTELGKSVKLAHEALRGLDLTMDNIGKNAAVDRLRDNASSLKVDAKEAAAQWKQLEADFIAFQRTFTDQGKKATPQDDLGFLVGRESTINPLNRDKLAAKEQPFRNQVAGHDFVGNQIDRLKDQVATIGLYNDSLKEANELDKIKEAAQKRNITLTQEQIDTFKGLITQIVESKDYTRELNALYEVENGPADKYNAQIDAMRKLMQDGRLTVDQFAEGLEFVTKQYNEATDSVVKFKNELAIQQREADSRLGTERQIGVQTQIESLDEKLRNTVDASHPTGYSEAEIKKVNDALTPLIQAQRDKIAVDQAANSLIQEQANLEDQLAVREQALAAAVKAGALSQAAANIERLKGQAQLNQLQIDNGTSQSASAPFIGAAAQDYLSQWQGMAKGIQEAFAPVFKTLTDGFADSIGRAIVYAKDLGSALRDVARSAIAELISGLIKLAIQYLIIDTLKKVFHKTDDPGATSVKNTAASAAASIAAIAAVTTASLVAASLLAPAWWTVAEAVSIASFGAADIAGVTGITAVKAIGTAAQAHKDGGPIVGAGTGRSDSILSWLSNGEYVVNAQAASQNRDLLDSINGGGQPPQGYSPQSGSTAGSGSKGMSVQVHNYASAKVETQQIDEHTVRLIVRDEAPQLIQQHAPKAVANDIANPNSQTSKAIYRNITPARVR